MRRFRRAPRWPGTGALVAAAATLIAGCGPPPPVDPDAFQRLAIEPLLTRWHALPGLMTFGDIEVVAGHQRFAGRVRALYVSPHRLRVDAELPGVFGLLGGAGTLWIDADGFWWRTVDDPQIRRGGEDPLFAPLFGRPPTLRDLEVLLFGLPAWWPTEQGGTSEQASNRQSVRKTAFVNGLPPSGELLLEWPDGTSERATLSGEPPRLGEIERRDERGTVLTVLLDAYRGAAGIDVPGRVRLRAPRTGDRLELRWHRVESYPDRAEERLDWPR
jgi:hypothetical protein